MESKNSINFVKRSLIFLSLMTGGIQLILFSFQSLINLPSFHDINELFFKLEFIPQNILSFWSIYLICYIFVVVIEKTPIRKKLFLNIPGITTALKNQKEESFLLLRPLLVICIESFTRFTTSLIVYLLKKDFVSLKRIFSFSDGFISWYIKLWIILLIIIYFITRYTILTRDDKAETFGNN
ncbi:MAG: hypothetical protein ACRDA4_02460 [Filifactoraceae bacterium]